MLARQDPVGLPAGKLLVNRRNRETLNLRCIASRPAQRKGRARYGPSAMAAMRPQRLPSVSAPCRHVREISDNQVDLAVGHVVSRKARHLHGGPTANRFRVANEGV